MTSWAPRAPPGGWHNASFAWHWWFEQPTNVRVFTRGELTATWHVVTHVDVPSAGFTVPTINRAILLEAYQYFVPPPPSTERPMSLDEVVAVAEEEETTPPPPPSGPDEETIPPPPPYPPSDWLHPR